MARQGKIARLPHALRDEVNRRLLDGQTSRIILKWLNAKNDAVAVWEAHFEGAPANPQNLSEWRTGGYRDWLNRRQKTENLKTLASFSLELAKAGGNISDGAAAIAGGQILETLERIASGSASDDPENEPDLLGLVEAVTMLRDSDTRKDNLKLNKRKESNKEKAMALNREKFEVGSIKIFMKWAATKEAQNILNSGKSKTIQMDLLRETIFGKRQ